MSFLCTNLTTNKPPEYSMISLKNLSNNILPSFPKKCQFETVLIECY